MDLLEYYTWGRTIIYDRSSLQMSKFMFHLQGLGICKMLKTLRQEKIVKMSKEWMCNQFFWSIFPRSISPVLYFLILNISLKVLPVYIYMLSYKGLLLLKVPIFLMPHILWFHNSVLACWMCSRIKSLALCIFLYCLLSCSKLTCSFSSWLELTMWAPFPKEFEYAPWVIHA